MVFSGRGHKTAAPVEQRSIAEWAHRMAVESLAGEGADAVLPEMTWHREGGIAGLCDTISISSSGFAYAADGVKHKSGSVYLDAARLEQMFQFFDSCQSGRSEWKDPAAADAMTITLSVRGPTNVNCDTTILEPMRDFAGEMYQIIQGTTG